MSDAALGAGGGREAVSFAIVLRTFEWDGFIERQIERYRAANPGCDVFVSVDDKRRTVGNLSDRWIDRAGTAELLALGLPNRYGKGSLVWWNNDYWYYAFQARHPDYAFYVFVEYDSVVVGSIATIVAAIAARHLDFVAAAVPGRLQDWSWWEHTSLVYAQSDIRASINCVAVLSNRALQFLFRRRLAMASDPSITHWPISEAFVATELQRAAFATAPLSEFGDTRDYNWFPPMLEDDIPQTDAVAFLHPVLDPPRYVASVTRFGWNLRPLLDRRSGMRRSLARMPFGDAMRVFYVSVRRRLKNNRTDRMSRKLLEAGRLPGW
jgi:hypothetical protein